ncbi:MAG TPA: serine hydrolase domain-containing protein [Longimicrobiales bacterium]
MRTLPRYIVTAVAFATLAAPVTAQTGQDHAAIRARVQAVLDSLHANGRFAGATAAAVLADGTTLAFAVGESDSVAGVPMRPTDRMLAGSVGKTFFAAVALQLVHEGRIALDDPLSKYLGDEPWWQNESGRVRLPNGRDITLRMLMRHTSGIVRYEFNPAFTSALTSDPYRVWRPAEQIAYVLDTEPPFAAGQGWEYSDTNYILLAMVIEKVTGERAYDLIRSRILEPLRLTNTVPSDSPVIPGLVQGYAGANNPFGGADAVLVDGRLAFNPQFEWAGGGYATTATDLARWARDLYEGRAFDATLLPQVLDGVEAPQLGRGARYGLGVIIRDTPLGPAWGHSGYFPGYLTEMRYFPDHRIAVAFQVNSSTGRDVGRSTAAIVQMLGEAVMGQR